jgi:hypothetical protein
MEVIMGWLAQKVMKWSIQKQENELKEFLQKVSAADSSELGLPVLMATVYRHIFRRQTGLDLLRPAEVLVADHLICWRLSREVERLQSKKEFISATPVIIWVHSLRAMGELQLRPLGRELWRELKRGFPYVLDASHEPAFSSLTSDDLEGYECVPDGLGERT